MKICVRDAFASDCYRKEYSFVLDNTQISDFPHGAVTDSVDVRAEISARDGIVSCALTVSADFSVICSRCAAEFTLPFRSFSVKQIKRRDDGEFEDVIFADGGFCFDIAKEARAQIYFEFPAKPLCREDCKGLCSVCGCDLNTGSCSCDIRTADPRLDVLRKLIDNN